MSQVVVTSGARQAALTLHAMAPEDRAWMLDALPQAHSAAIRVLLQELQALGIPADAASAPAAPAMAVQETTKHDIDLHALNEDKFRALVQILGKEPAGLVASFLAADAWRWGARVLAALDPGHASEVEKLSHAGTPPDALRRALLITIQERLSNAGSPSPTPIRRQGWAQSILQRRRK